MMIKKLLVLCVAMATFTVTQATERFVKFTPVEGALPLSNASISYSADEYEGVKIAINNLKIGAFLSNRNGCHLRKIKNIFSIPG